MYIKPKFEVLQFLFLRPGSRAPHHDWEARLGSCLTMRGILPSYRVSWLVVFGSPYGTTMVLRVGCRGSPRKAVWLSVNNDLLLRRQTANVTGKGDLQRLSNNQGLHAIQLAFAAGTRCDSHIWNQRAFYPGVIFRWTDCMHMLWPFSTSYQDPICGDGTCKVLSTYAALSAPWVTSC